MNDPEVQSFMEVLAQQPWIEEMRKTLEASEVIKRERPHWIEPHAIAVRFGLPLQQAKLFLRLPGYLLRYKVYHWCSDCPVDVFDVASLPDVDVWYCPGCGESVWKDEIFFEEVGVRISEENSP